MAMDERLQAVGDGVYALDIGVNLGVADIGGGKAALFDTGLTKDAAKKIVKALATINLTPAVIFNTHAHADHFGGNAHLVEKYGAQVYCPPEEAATLRYPMLEPISLYAGAAPIKDLTGHFLLAPASAVDVPVAEGVYTVGERGVTVQAVALPGHSAQHYGYIVGGLFCVGDIVLAPDVLAKHGVPFCHNVGVAFASLDKLEGMGRAGAASAYLPCHAPLTRDIQPLVDANRAAMEAISAAMVRAIAAGDGLTTADVQTAVADTLGMHLATAAQYYLMHLTIHAYLGYLIGRGLIRYSFADNRLLWRAANLTPSPFPPREGE